jgi:NADPH-dependent 2,4-dienoyl-CoA reductase/sulfur reductase-like enzyme
MSRKVVIIGNGIAGVTCARHLRKQDSAVQITIISGESEHFYSRTALMYIYMGQMKYENTKPYEDHFWKKNRIELVWDWVESVDFDGKIISSKKNGAITYTELVLATGSRPISGIWPGEELEGVQGLYSLQDLELMMQQTKDIDKAVIVGGGLIGIEMAEMLYSRNIQVTILVREKHFWNNVLPVEEAQLIDRHIISHGIDLRLSTELREIVSDGTGRVKGVMTKSGDFYPCGFVGLAVGVKPNIDFVRNSKLHVNVGISVDERFQTSIPDVYAIGDCAEFREPPGISRKRLEQVWYTGRMHGETLGYNLANNKPVAYKPGVWYNSAKFFDLEYQTYGNVTPVWGEAVESLYWEDAEGKACFRMLYDQESQKILGVNSIGWRLRHVYFDQAIEAGKKAGVVIQELEKADFKPEFYRPYHYEIQKKFEREKGIAIQKKESLMERIRRVWS